MTRQQDELDDFGRFAEPALMILISLADGPKHGYAMTDDIEEVSGVRFGPGTLYGAITRLEGKVKMSQNREPRDRAGVVSGHTDRASGHDSEIASLVEKLNR